MWGNTSCENQRQSSGFGGIIARRTMFAGLLGAGRVTTLLPEVFSEAGSVQAKDSW